MSDLADLIAIYRAIDQAVVRDGTGANREVVARYIPQYQDDATPGWTRALDRFLAPRDAESAGPPVGQSLSAALKHIARVPPRGRLQSRFLLVLAVLGRLPEHGLSDADMRRFERAVRAFQPPSADIGDDALLELLLDDEVFPEVGAWGVLMQEAASSNALPRSGTVQGSPCLCTLEVVKVDDDPDPVTRLETYLCSDTVTDKQVRAFLDPATWADCSPLYCDMISKDGAEPLAADGHGRRYIEVLSPDCEDPEIEKIVVCLVFTLAKDSDACYTLTYGLCPDESEGNGKVVHDSGTIIVERSKQGWCFSTTKYLRFEGVANGAALSLVACALGYATFAEDFLHCVHTDREPPTPEPVEPEPADWDGYLPVDGDGPAPEPVTGDDADPGWDA